MKMAACEKITSADCEVSALGEASDAVQRSNGPGFKFGSSLKCFNTLRQASDSFPYFLIVAPLTSLSR